MHYGGLSDIAMHAIGGLLRHAGAIAAFTNPTTNSYKRLVSGYEAPVHLAYSSRNRAAAVRIPVYNQREDTKRLELRWPDPSANPYVAFAAITMAALDGIRNEIDPGDPIDVDLETVDPERLSKLGRLPISLDEALNDLDHDRDFLTVDGVFSNEIIDGWINYKRLNEVRELSLRPHPYEFCMYYDL